MELTTAQRKSLSSAPGDTFHRRRRIIAVHSTFGSRLGPGTERSSLGIGKRSNETDSGDKTEFDLSRRKAGDEHVVSRSSLHSYTSRPVFHLDAAWDSMEQEKYATL